MIEIAISVMIACNNSNWLHSPECQSPPTEIHQTTTGFYGYLENGKYWTQERYTKDLMVFRLENVCLVVSGYGTWDC